MLEEHFDPDDEDDERTTWTRAPSRRTVRGTRRGRGRGRARARARAPSASPARESPGRMVKMYTVKDEETRGGVYGGRRAPERPTPRPARGARGRRRTGAKDPDGREQGARVRPVVAVAEGSSKTRERELRGRRGGAAEDAWVQGGGADKKKQKKRGMGGLLPNQRGGRGGRGGVGVEVGELVGRDVPGFESGGIAARSADVQREIPFTPSAPTASPRPPPSPSRASNSPRSSPASSSSPPSTPGARGAAGASGPGRRRHGVGAGDDAGDRQHRRGGRLRGDGSARGSVPVRAATVFPWTCGVLAREELEPWSSSTSVKLNPRATLCVLSHRETKAYPRSRHAGRLPIGKRELRWCRAVSGDDGIVD